MAFTLAPLPYAHDALEPHIDTTTMQIHHGKHHQAYVDNLNKAIAGTEHENKSLEELVKPQVRFPRQFVIMGEVTGIILFFGKAWMKMQVACLPVTWQKLFMMRLEHLKLLKKNLPMLV